MSIQSCVTISLVPQARGGPFVFWDDLEAACRGAGELGFDAVEIFAPAADAIAHSELRRILDSQGLKLAAVGTGAGWLLHRLTLTHADAENRARARAFIRSLIDFAGALGAPAIIGSMQGRAGDGVERAAALGHLAEALDDLGEHAERFGVPLLYEPLNRYETNLVNTVAGGVELLTSLSTQNVKILADLFHMNIEEHELSAALRAGAGWIGHVHFVDSNRQAAGRGHIDFGPIALALAETGYDGYASAECLPCPDPNAAARQTIETFRRHFRPVL